MVTQAFLRRAARVVERAIVQSKQFDVMTDYATEVAVAVARPTADLLTKKVGVGSYRRTCSMRLIDGGVHHRALGARNGAYSMAARGHLPVPTLCGTQHFPRWITLHRRTPRTCTYPTPSF